MACQTLFQGLFCQNQTEEIYNLWPKTYVNFFEQIFIYNNYLESIFLTL